MIKLTREMVSKKRKRITSLSKSIIRKFTSKKRIITNKKSWELTHDFIFLFLHYFYLLNPFLL